MNIILELICGRDLTIKDIYTSDPYIKFKVGDQKYKSRVIPSTLDPDWHEQFSIQCKPGEEIEFKCWDKDSVGKDDKMGKSIWKVPLLTNNKKEYFLLPNDVQGDIIISAICLSGGKDLIELPYCDVYMDSFFKMELLAGFFDESRYKRYYEEFQRFKLVVRTSHGKCVMDVTETLKEMKYYFKELPSELQKLFYYKGSVGEKVELIIYGRKKDCEFQEVVSSSFIIADYYDGEFHKQKVYFGPDQFVFKITCVKSIYTNVRESSVPVVIKNKTTKDNEAIGTIPTIHCAKDFPSSEGSKISKIKIDFATGKRESYVVFSRKESDFTTWQDAWNSSRTLSLPFKEGSVCHVKVTIKRVSEEKSVNHVFEGSFIWKDTLTPQKSVDKYEVKTLDESKTLFVLEVRYFRGITPHFSKTYFGDDGKIKQEYVRPLEPQ